MSILVKGWYKQADRRLVRAIRLKVGGFKDGLSMLYNYGLRMLAEDWYELAD